MTPKKILVIMGSPRKGNTFRACEELRGILEQELAVEFEYLWLKDANLLPCKGCYTCIPRGEEKCPNRDDAPLIELKMREADGVIFASPVYGMNVTGQMKIFVDRFCYIFHRPRFFDKKAFLLTTTGALGIREVLGYMDTVAGVWGFEVAGRAGLIIPPGSSPVPRRITKNRKVLLQAAKEFSAALQMKTRKSPGLISVIIFHAQRAAFSQMEKVSPCDYQYWKTRGWLSPKARYYVDVPVNPLYGVIGSIFEWIQVRNIRKDLQEAVVP
jgi:multimeric flavodoxin WrbA